MKHYPSMFTVAKQEAEDGKGGWWLLAVVAIILFVVIVTL